MADFTALKTTIQTYIKQNGNEEITGNILQEVLLAMVQTMGDSAINDLVTDLSGEVTARQNADTTLGNSLQAIHNAIDNGYVYAGIATPTGTPVSGKVFYFAVTAGTYTNFGGLTVTQGINILKYNGSAWSVEQVVGIDDVPTAGSGSLVKSGGVNNAVFAKADKEDTEPLTKAYKKQIIPRDTTTTVIDPDSNGKFAVTIPANSYYDIMVKDPDSSISSIAAMFIIKHGSSSRTALGNSYSANTNYRFYTEDELDYVCIYVPRSAMSPDTAIVELCVYDEKNALYDINQNKNDIESQYQKVLGEYSMDIATTSGGSFNPDTTAKLAVDIKQGESFSVKVIDANSVVSSLLAIYAIYHGSSSRTAINKVWLTPMQSNVSYDFIAANDIDFICIYGITSAVGTVKLSVVNKSAVKYHTDKNTSDLVEVKKDLYAEWEKDVEILTVGDVISPNTNGKTPVDISAGEKFTIEVIDEYESLTDDAVKGLYAFYKSAPNSQINLMYDAVSNTEYEFTAADDIVYIGVWVESGVISKKTCITINVTGTGIKKKVEELANNSIDEFLQEANDAIKRFIPISSTTPIDNIQQLSDSDFIENVNLLFMTDSHIDYTAAAESMQNVENAIKFANRGKRIVQLVNSRINDHIFDAVIHTGDILTRSNPDKNVTLAYAQSFFDKTKDLDIPLLFAPGNHDRNDSNQIPSAVITDQDWMNLYGDYAEQHYGIVRQTKSNGKKSQWFYKDIDEKKVRIISVYVNDVDYSVTNQSGKVLWNESNGWYIAQEQMDWLVSTALDFDDKTDKDWGVVVILHQSIRITSNLTNKPWYSTGSSLPQEYQFESSIQKFFEVCKAFNTQGTYTNEYDFATDSFYDLDISADFTRYANLEKKPHMICWLNGHEHIDYNMVKDGINIIWTAQQSAMMAFSDKRVPRLIGTSTQNLFDLISIDTTHRKIKIVRVGAGLNCYGDGGDRFLPDGLSY